MLRIEMLEEYQECTSIEEVEALTLENKLDDSFDDECQAAHNAAIARLTPTEEPTTQPPVKEETPQEDEMAALKRKIEELEMLLKQGVSVKAPALPRVARKWTLQSKDVSWSTKPQVHALMHIIAANVVVGEEVSEDKIVAAVEANAVILRTKQPAKRIWDYYKGDHADGLLAHGNLVKK